MDMFLAKTLGKRDAVEAGAWILTMGLMIAGAATCFFAVRDLIIRRREYVSGLIFLALGIVLLLYGISKVKHL